jgi:hypothetical protein
MANGGMDQHRIPYRQEAVLDLLREGYTLTKACLQCNEPYGTVATWIERDTEGFYAKYKAARRTRAWLWHESAVDFADECDGDSASQVRKAELRGKVRRDAVARDLPEVFGDGEDSGANAQPIQIILHGEQKGTPALPD